MARIRPKKKGDKTNVTEIFCYECKEYIPITAKKQSEAIRLFRENGHHSDRRPFLSPNVGREHWRFTRAIKLKEAEAT